MGRAPQLISVFFLGAMLLITGPVPGGGLSGHRVADATPTGANTTGGWSPFPSDPDQPFARSYASIAFDSIHGLGLLYGGIGPSGATLNDTWVDDGDVIGTWAANHGPGGPSPPALAHAALAYDAVTDTFVLFGGTLANGSAYGSSWTFHNFQWTAVPSTGAPAPPADADPSLATDPANGGVLLVSSTDPGATWVLNSSGWHGFPASEGARVAPALAGDPLTGGVLLFGGRASSASGEPLNDTWRWTGAAWTKLPTTSAPPPAVGAMAFDPRIPGMLEVSWGSGLSTWSLGATAWSRTVGPAPPGRSGGQLYFDSPAGFDILFGGTDANGTVLSDVWGWSVPPPPSDPSLGAVGLSPVVWGEVGALVAIPIAIAFLLRRRPPRARPAEAPAATAAAA